jgi:hypothetical protein
MRELRINREVHRREAAAANGRPVHNPIHLAVHTRFSGQMADYMALPEDTASQVLMQNSSGAFFMMLDFSALDGPDPLM